MEFPSQVVSRNHSIIRVMRVAVPIPAVAAASLLHSAAVGGFVAAW